MSKIIGISKFMFASVYFISRGVKIPKVALDNILIIHLIGRAKVLVKDFFGVFIIPTMCHSLETNFLI